MKWRAQDLCSSFTLSLSRLMAHRGWQVTGVRQQVGRLKPPSGNVKADHAHPAPPALNLLCPPFSKASAGVFFFFLTSSNTKKTYLPEDVFSVSEIKTVSLCLSGIRFINCMSVQTDEAKVSLHHTFSPYKHEHWCRDWGWSTCAGLLKKQQGINTQV